MSQYSRQDICHGGISLQAGPSPGKPPGGRPGQRRRPTSRRVLLPLILFSVTCGSTYWVQRDPMMAHDGRGGIWIKFRGSHGQALAYAGPLMIILTAHELGHFLQARRYGVPASYPYFIPMPVGPFGTMGAVMAMHPGIPNRRALFDIGVTGPLLGLVPAFVCTVWGLCQSQVIPMPDQAMSFGDPLVFKLLELLRFGPLPAGHHIDRHPLYFAGWVGLFLTGLNLLPVGQLDGGHVLYALLGRRAELVSWTLLICAALWIYFNELYYWWLMLGLLVLFGPGHPPTMNDDQRLGWGRKLVGCLALLFVVIGFTPEPLVIRGP